jgi:hypothetical protein
MSHGARRFPLGSEKADHDDPFDPMPRPQAMEPIGKLAHGFDMQSFPFSPPPPQLDFGLALKQPYERNQHGHSSKKPAQH